LPERKPVVVIHNLEGASGLDGSVGLQACLAKQQSKSGLIARLWLGRQRVDSPLRLLGFQQCVGTQGESLNPQVTVGKARSVIPQQGSGVLRPALLFERGGLIENGVVCQRESAHRRLGQILDSLGVMLPFVFLIARKEVSPPIPLGVGL